MIFICILSAIGSVSAAVNNTTVNETNSSGLDDSDWPSFQNNANKTGQSNYTGPQTNTTKWIYGNVTVYGSAVIGDNGTIYVAGTDGILYTFSSVGELLWTWTTRSGIYGSPTIGNDGTIYISNWMNSTTYAISSTGELIWKCTTGDYNFGSSPVIGSDGTVYVSVTDDSNGVLYAIDSEGNIKWSYVMGMVYGTSPVIGADGTIYMADYDGVIYAINPDGNLKWSYTLRYSYKDTLYYVNVYYNSLSIGDDGTIYITGHNGRYISSKDPIRSDDEIRSYIGLVYALVDTGTGCVEKWSYNIGEAVYGVPAISSDGTVYVVGASGLYALDSDGNLIVNYPYYTGVTSDTGLTSAVVGADGVVYFGAGNGFYAINPDGSLLWSYSMDGVVGSAAISSDGTLYIGSDGTFYAFNDIVADFVMDYVTGTVSMVQFTGDTTGTAESWEWDFGDGTTSTEQNPTHTYNEAGVYKVTLTVTLEDGSTVIKIEKMTIVEQDVVVPTVSSDNGGGTYEDTQHVTLSAVDDSDTVIYYTTDGSDPLTSGTRKVYSGSLAVNDSMTLKYAAVDSYGNWSPVYTEEYVIVDVVYVESASSYDSKTINADIQAILDNADSGSKIIFKGASYSDLQLVINRQLNIISNVGTTITTGSSGSAVFIFNGSDASGSSITGFIILTSTDSGILVDGADDVTISDVQVTSSDGTAITIKESNNTTIEDCTMTDSITGIHVYNSSNTQLNGNTITNSQNGVSIENSSDISINGGVISNNEENGVKIYNSSNTTITGTSITGNGLTGVDGSGKSGVYIEDSDDVEVSDCQITGNWYGINTNNINNTGIKYNIINDNSRDGIILNGDTVSSTISSNYIQRNNNGIQINGYNENLLINGNIITDSQMVEGVNEYYSGDGILFGADSEASSSLIINHNFIVNNEHRDIETRYGDCTSYIEGSNWFNKACDGSCGQFWDDQMTILLTRTGDGTFTLTFYDGNDADEVVTDLLPVDVTFYMNGNTQTLSTTNGTVSITYDVSELIGSVTATVDSRTVSTSVLSEIIGEIKEIWEGFTDQSTSEGSSGGSGSGDGSNSGGSGSGDGSGSDSGSGISSGSSSSDGTSTGALSVGVAAASAASSGGSSSGQYDSSSGQDSSSETVQELILNQDPSLWGILAIILIIIIVTGTYYRRDIIKMVKKSRE